MIEPHDITAGRHGGNQESVEANPKKEAKERARRKIVELISLSCGKGMTLDELAVVMETTPNCISGRITSLKNEGVITQIDRRETRTGCKAAVYALNTQPTDE